jgi:hypothetical protein
MESVHLVPSSPTFWDKAGMWLSYGCAVHCAAMPFIIGYLSLNGMGWIAEESTEWAIIAASLSLGLFRLFYSYFKEHRQPEPVLLFIAGLLSILIAKGVILEAPEQLEPFGMVAGGLLIGTAHFRNQAKCRCCQPLVGARTNG